MYFTADLHIHSHYAKATSPKLNLETLYQWARIKGVNVIGTGDFTHPAWFRELKEKLVPDGSGFFILKDPPDDLPGYAQSKYNEVRFCLTSEINCETIYGNKLRRIHNLVYAPDFETVQKINDRLSKMTDLAEDGRPTIKLPSRDLLEIVLESSPDAHFVPAHIWTPWFSLLGAVYGYDSVEECFRDLTPHIFAVETSLSADPLMCGKFSGLDKYTFMSNSDAHSAENVGREINRFNTALSYSAMFEAVKTKKGFLGTYEFFPALGKYYYDGHRNCKVSLSPAESNHLKQVCPVCGKKVTVGTSSRNERLSDRTVPVNGGDFKYIVPLPEILSEIHGLSTESKKVKQEFAKAITNYGNEFELLHDLPVEEIHKKDHILSLAISRMRNGQMRSAPGYDGAYGYIYLFEEGELEKLKKPQMSLF